MTPTPMSVASQARLSPGRAISFILAAILVSWRSHRWWWVYGGGGNSGAELKNDFIELFNAGDVDVEVDGWSVQYASAAGSRWQVAALAGSIPPGSYCLVQQAASAGGSQDLPAPDAEGTINMSATNGEVALRLDDGCVDTQDNAADFVAGEPDPGYVAFLEPGNDIGGINTGQQEILHDRPPLLLRALLETPHGELEPVSVAVNHTRSFIGIANPTTGFRVRSGVYL